MKRNLKRWLYHFISNNGIQIVISILFIIILVFICMNSTVSIDNVFDFTIFSALIFTFLLQVMERLLEKKLLNYLEDEVKLDSNYERIVKRYTHEFITYSNDDADKKSLYILQRSLKTNMSEFKFPVECVGIFNDVSLQISDSIERYEKPSELDGHMDELLLTHDTSNVYNQLNIRIADWTVDGNMLFIKTMRTTYFDSLMTNRAMDYKWSNGMTNRDVFQFGPFLPSLSDSNLSNHIGFNGFIISSDDYIPFIKRNHIVSIGKNTYGDSIGASLKAKYALDSSSQRLTEQGIEEAFLQEINDELKIDKNNIKKFSVENNLIAAYRDFVEGGKPQFLIYAEVDMTRENIESNFNKKINEKNNSPSIRWNKELKELEDGDKAYWIHLFDLKKLAISPGLVVHNKKKLTMMPSATASIILFMEWCEKTNFRKHKRKDGLC